MPRPAVPRTALGLSGTPGGRRGPMAPKAPALPEVRDPELRATLARMGQMIATREDPTPPTPPAPVLPLPVFPAEARPAVNAMARGALFACVQGKDRQRLDNALLATVADVEIRFDGVQLNQDDHDVLMVLVHLVAATRAPLGTHVLIPAYAILQALGRDTGGTQYRQLRDDIKRLVAGTVSLRHTTRRMEYFGHLVDAAVLDERTQHWLIRLNPDLRALYGRDTYTLIDWEERLRLRGKDLARWLHLYLASHAAPFPVKVATLHRLSGSQTAALWKFRERLKEALTDLQAIGALAGWTIDTDDLVHVDRGRAIPSSQHHHLTREERQKP